MGELRKDYVLDRYVIINSDRGKRPDQFKQEITQHKRVDVCDFCPGNEHMTPPETERFPEKNKDWQIRVFPNKFAAVKPEGQFEIKTDNNFYTYSSAFGYHEVIAETPNHDEILADQPEERISNLLNMFKKRIQINMNCDNIKYVSVFKNQGIKAGTSIQHPHCQLIAYNKVPKLILEKEAAFKKYKECPYCSLWKMEKDSHRRCFENPRFVAFTPYASRYPFEVLIMPKRHVVNITEFNNQEFVYLAEILKKVLLKLKELNADYNFYLQYGIEKMHFHIEICPRLSTWAGFEKSTDCIINSMPPEKAAEFYRGYVSISSSRDSSIL